MSAEPVLSATQRAFLASVRRAVLATIGPDGRPRLVPICFVLHDTQPVLYSPIDEKPKRTADPLALGRVQDVLTDPRVSVLVDHWDEDWVHLGWLRCHGVATLVLPTAADAPEHAKVVVDLQTRYLQYAAHRLEGRPIIRIAIESATSWGDLAP